MPTAHRTAAAIRLKGGTFRMVPDKLTYDPRLESLDVRLWCVLSHSGRFRGYSTATDEWISRYLKVSTPTIQRSLSRLHKAGYIRRARTPCGGRKTTLHPEGDRSRIEIPGNPRSGRYESLHDGLTPERLIELQSMPYNEYLQTPEWKRKRDWVQADDGNACRICNQSHDQVTLDVHHRTYERRGREDRLDLITLCRDCHQCHHDKDNRHNPV